MLIGKILAAARSTWALNLLTTDAATENGLVSAKQAETNLTGGTAWAPPTAVDSTDRSEWLRETPITIASVGVPFIIPPGDGAAVGLQFTGTAGAFTLSAAILTNAWNALKGCWMYLPANFGGSTCPAGWYWAVFSSDTAGIVYTDTYVSGKPVRPNSPVAFSINLTGWLTSTTSEITGPTGFTLSRRLDGPSGSLKSAFARTGNRANNRFTKRFLDQHCPGYQSSNHQTSPGKPKLYQRAIRVQMRCKTIANNPPGVGAGVQWSGRLDLGRYNTSIRSKRFRSACSYQRQQRLRYFAARRRISHLRSITMAKLTFPGQREKPTPNPPAPPQFCRRSCTRACHPPAEQIIRVYTGVDAPPAVSQRIITTEAFRDRFTAAEMLAVVSSSDAQIKYALLKLSTKEQQIIDLDNPEVATIMARLVTLGLITSARSTAILA